MKRILSFLLALTLLAALAACGGSPASPTATPAPSPDAEPQGGTADGVNTVTVSTIEELANAIGDDTTVILKAGTYNFSQLDVTEVDNAALKSGAIYGGLCEYSIVGVSNLTIEAEEGAQVEIVTELSISPVLCFDSCENIFLKGFTCGHAVQAGNCTGSVVYAYRTEGLSIDGCSLYGCGTYGVEADRSSLLAVTDTEIYGCSYGIVCLENTEDAEFTNCSFHDNYGYSMFTLSECKNIFFKDTEIFDNELYNGAYFPIDYVNTTDVNFENCSFENNFPKLNTYEYNYIGFEGCTFEYSEEHVGYVRVSESFDQNNIIRLSINEVTWINWDDEELMEEYGITYDDMTNDYYIVDDDEEYYPFMALKDSTEFAILKPDPEYGFAATTTVDYSEFLEALSPYGEAELFVSYTLDEGSDTAARVITYIGEKYVP